MHALEHATLDGLVPELSVEPVQGCQCLALGTCLRFGGSLVRLCRGYLLRCRSAVACTRVVIYPQRQADDAAECSSE